ncbi:MAG: bifunctional nuclease domain-containing protein [Armatimonadota bacterium]
MQMTDAELVLLAKSDDKDSFGELVRRYQGLIYGLAYHQIGNFTDAQDIAQDAFVNAFRSLHQLEQPERFVAWLKAITANECKSWLRSHRHHVSLDETLQDHSSDAMWRDHECQAEIRQAVDSLPEKNRLVITLHYLSGLSCKEIGEYMGISANTVTQHLYRARYQLKDMLMAKIEEGYTMSKLPDSFANEVLERVELCPIAEGGFITVGNEGDYRGFMMGIGERKPDNRFIEIWMKQDDLNDIILGMNPDRSSENAKGRALDSSIQILELFDIELKRIVLRLADHRKCRAVADFSQRDTRLSIDMRPSDAIGLAVRVKAPILVEEAVVLKGNVGEDDVPVPDYSIDTPAYNIEFEKQRQHEALRDQAFEMGLSIEDMIDTMRFQIDDEAGVIRMWIEAIPESVRTFDLREYGPGMDMILDLAKRNGTTDLLHGDMVRGWSGRTRFYYSMLGSDVRIRAVSEPIEAPVG